MKKLKVLILIILSIFLVIGLLVLGNKILNKVYDIYEAVESNLDLYFIADNYVNMLREVDAF